MKKKWLVALGLVNCLISVGAQSEQTLTLNMADGITTLNYPVEFEEKITVSVENLAPKKLKDYVFGVVYKATDIPVLDVKGSLGQQLIKYNTPIPKTSSVRATACDELKVAFQSLLDSNVEADVPLLIDELNKSLESLNNATDNQSGDGGNQGGPCKIIGAENADKSVQKLIDSTKHVITLNIQPNLGATLTVSDGSKDSKLKVLAVNTEGKSKWITSFGFGFYESQNKTYFSKPNGNVENPGFKIVEQADREEWSYSAQVIFTYPLTNWQTVDIGLSAGLGASQDNVQVLGGISAIVAKNVVVTGGVSIQEFTILKGQYEEGQEIGNEPIDSTALTDKTFKYTPMVALSFRF